MKIIYCIAATHNSGGMERVLANKTNWLCNHGYDISVITTDQRGLKPFFKMHPNVKFYDLGVNYEENNNTSFLNKLIHYPSKQAKHKNELEKLLLRLKADIVISMFCNDVNILPEIKDGSKKILEIHFSKYKRLQYGRKGIWKLADIVRTKHDEVLVKKYDAFVVLTNEDKTYWGNLSNIHVIGNAKSFHYVETNVDRKKLVIAIGRYNQQKAFNKLISIWNLVNQSNPTWRLEIIGDGELKNDLQRQIQDLNLTNSIQLLPATSNIQKKYQEASILVMTSIYEGLPMVLIESQTFGLPIVSYACKCGPKEVITDGLDGFLIEENNELDFANKLTLLMKNDELRQQMSNQARLSSTRFSEEVIMKKWTDLFNQIMQ